MSYLVYVTLSIGREGVPSFTLDNGLWTAAERGETHVNKIEDDLIFLENGRRPHFFLSKCMMAPNFQRNGRQPNF